MMRRIAHFLVAGILLTAVPGQAWSLELKAASGSPPSHPSYDPMYTTFMSELEKRTNGEVTVRHIGLEVVNLRQLPTAIPSGLVDLGNLIPSYFPSDFPNMMLMGELGPVGANGMAKMGAMIEYWMTCESCKREYLDKGLVYVNGTSTWASDLLVVGKPVRTLEDVRGLRLRNPGGYGTTWIATMGAVPIETSFNEEFEALQTGLADGSLAPPENLIGNRLFEVVRYHTPLGIGTFHTLSNFTIGKAAWAKLSPDQKRAYVEASIEGVVAFAARAREVGLKGLQEVYAKGGETVEPSQALIDANEAFRVKAKETAVELGTSRYGIEDAEEKVARFAALVEKWTGLAESVDNDPDKMAELIWDEVWAKIDLASYGN